MGLVVSRYRTPDPLGLLPALRARSEAHLGRSVSLVVDAPYYTITVLRQARPGSLTVVVFERQEILEVSFGMNAWRSEEVRTAREALRGLGATESPSWRSIRYRFPARAAGVPPTPEEVAHAMRGRLVQRHPPWAYLRSGLRTSVEIEIHEGGFELQAPIVIFGKLFDAAVTAAGELAEKVPLGRAG